MFKNLNVFRGKDGECQREFSEDGFLALHSGQLVELLPEYAITYDPLYLYYPYCRGHLNVFKLIVDALKVKAV